MMSNRLRAILLIVILLLVTPTVVSALTHDDLSATSISKDKSTTQNITFVSLQGREIGGQGARLVAFDTETKEPIWIHDRYRKAYYDVDPINESTVLFVAGNDTEWDAIMMNWQTGVVYDRFAVPKDTHDIDYVGNSTYAISDMENHRAYMYDRSNDSVVWEFDYTERYPPSAGENDDYSGDDTHINDIDVHDNGTTVLVSPRNFDRVSLLNRTSDQIEWTLGEEDNYSILYEQHNPVLLSESPPTVLVADSENDRIVEYRKSGDEWNLVWEYRGKLNWPRDADRLPNGNTLIVDSRGDRVLEVTPGREVVWELRVAKFPYDVERVSLGEEPRGPSMAEFSNQFATPEDPQEQGTLLLQLTRRFDWAYDMSQWIAPWWVSKLDFGVLVLALGVTSLWGYYEAASYARNRFAQTHRWKSKVDPSTLALLLSCFLFGLGAVVGSMEVLSKLSFAPLSMDIAHVDPFELAFSLLLVYVGNELAAATDIDRKLGLPVFSILRYALAAAGLVFGLKLLQLYLVQEDTILYVGTMLLLAIFCVRPFLELVATSLPVSRAVHERLRIPVASVMILAGLVMLFLGLQSFYRFGTFVGPGIVLFAIGRTTLSRDSSEPPQLTQWFLHAAEVVGVALLLVTTSLAVGLGSGVATVTALGFAAITVGYLGSERLKNGAARVSVSESTTLHSTTDT